MHHSIINLTLTQWNTIKFPKKLATPSFRRSFHKNLININYGCEISGINTMNKHYIVIILLYCVYTNFIAFLSIYNYIYIYIKRSKEYQRKIKISIRSQFTDVNNRNLYGRRTNYGRGNSGNIGNTISFPIFLDGLFSKKICCCCEWRASINRFED